MVFQLAQQEWSLSSLHANICSRFFSFTRSIQYHIKTFNKKEWQGKRKPLYYTKLVTTPLGSSTRSSPIVQSPQPPLDRVLTPPIDLWLRSGLHIPWTAQHGIRWSLSILFLGLSSSSSSQYSDLCCPLYGLLAAHTSRLTLGLPLLEK